jgi:catechol 2,3-dioxygenase-like lactoylglutathione lyase family enzyme
MRLWPSWNGTPRLLGAAFLVITTLLSPAAAVGPDPVTTEPWSMATASVTDLDRTAAFFRTFGAYETVHRGPVDPREIAAYGLPEGASGEQLVLRPPGAEHGLVRLVRFDDAGRKVPMRPGARAWDTGCYWSLMVRMKGMESIYDEAIAMGWWTETPIARIEFGPSVLDVVVFKGPDGLQVQGYERKTTPLPEGFTPFERMSRPFNIMQMTRDRSAARELMEDVLGFDRFYYGEPYTDDTPRVMPLGIPKNLTTTVPYIAGIFYPVPGEYGRLEYIEIDGLEGLDHSGRCQAPNLGWLSVTYPVADAAVTARTIEARGGVLEAEGFVAQRPPFGEVSVIQIRTPDGALIEFASAKD